MDEDSNKAAGAQRLFEIHERLQAEALADRDERLAAANRVKRDLDQLRLWLQRAA